LHEYIKPANRDCRKRFCEEILQKIDSDEVLLDSICFYDEPTFHLNDTVNRHSCRIVDSQPPKEIIEYQRDTPKVNVWCGMMKDHIIGPVFFFQGATMTNHLYLYMLEHYTVPQLSSDAWIQQAEVPP
jgi:hypothetical protein